MSSSVGICIAGRKIICCHHIVGIIPIDSTLIVASIIGQKRELILTAGPRLLAAPALLHLGGFALGYLMDGVDDIAPRLAFLYVTPRARIDCALQEFVFFMHGEYHDRYV